MMEFYSPEFKADAVALYLSDPDLTPAGVAGLGCEPGRTRDWVRAEGPARPSGARP
ncbi:hypothetical protein GCM10010278_86000 [Streptomyces melanogenes]|nr:hypothetical protein GCM10010278_86000 [Streptomyces melanogenes]